MRHYNGFVACLSQLLDKIAGLCLVGVMTLVVANIIMRSVFKQPILGTYDYVGFLTAVAIGLALAHCALQNAHIAVGFVLDRFPRKIQAMVDTLTNFTAVAFWSISFWYLTQYAAVMSSNGIVSSTTQIPIHPFIYLVALGLLGLCLVLVTHLSDSLKRVMR